MIDDCILQRPVSKPSTPTRCNRYSIVHPMHTTLKQRFRARHTYIGQHMVHPVTPLRRLNVLW
jgi:hypothetical protein